MTHLRAVQGYAPKACRSCQSYLDANALASGNLTGVSSSIKKNQRDTDSARVASISDSTLQLLPIRLPIPECGSSVGKAHISDSSA